MPNDCGAAIFVEINKNLDMKKCILFIVALSMGMNAWSQTDNQSIQVTDVDVVRADGVVTIAFALQTGAKVTANNRSLIINPVLRSADGQTELPPIVVQGAKANPADVRQAMSQALIDPNVTPYYTTNGQFLDYVATVPYQNWMRGSELVFGGINAAGGKATEVNIGQVADNLLYADAGPQAAAPRAEAPQPVAAPASAPAPVNVSQAAPAQPTLAARYAQPSVVQYQQPTAVSYTQPAQQQLAGGAQTTGDELATRFSFVEPDASFERARRTTEQYLFDYNMPLNLGGSSATERLGQSDTERFVGMTRTGALYIQFRQGSSAIPRELGHNNRMLVDLISAIRAIEISPDTRVSHVVIVGFSSPEGTMSENEKLSQERAAVAKEFLTANSNIKADLINVYNGSVDWASLREQVAASNMPDKYKILDIIDNTPVWDSARNRGRQGELMELNGGDSYRYMVQNFFPQLRQMGAYVKVYYENIR